MKLWFKKGPWASSKARKKIRELSPDKISSIAVIRHAAMGDMVLTRGFLVELRKAFKNATITLSIASNYTRGVPEDLVDRVHVIHGSDQRKVSFLERLKRFRELGYHDIIFDLAASNRSFMTCVFNKAGLKVGFPYRKLQSKLYYDVAVTRTDLSFELDDMLSMLNIFGFKTDIPYRFELPVEPLYRPRPYVIYFAGASVKTKCWPDNNYSELITKMAAEYDDHDHLILEGIQEWEKADPILNPLKHLENVGNITADTIDETQALLKGASLVVANDTGIRNLAIVCDTPTVGIFFDTFPFRYWPRAGNHEISMMLDGAAPPADEVFSQCKKVMARAFAKNSPRTTSLQ